MSINILVTVAGVIDTTVEADPNAQLLPLDPASTEVPPQPGMGSSFRVDIAGDAGIFDLNRWIANSGLFDRQMDGILGDDWGIVQLVGDVKWSGPGFASFAWLANRSFTNPLPGVGLGPRFATWDFNDVTQGDPTPIRMQQRPLWTGNLLLLQANDDLGAPIAGPHCFSVNLVRIRGITDPCCFGDLQVVAAPAPPA